MAGVVEKLALQSHWASPSHGLWSDVDHGLNYSGLSSYMQLHHKSPLYNLCELYFIFSATGPNLEGFFFFPVCKHLFTPYVASKSCLSFRSWFKVTFTQRMFMIHRESWEHLTAHSSSILPLSTTHLTCDYFVESAYPIWLWGFTYLLLFLK